MKIRAEPIIGSKFIMRKDIIYHAILSLDHVNELLFKYMLKRHRELNSYMKAKEDMKKRNKENIFEVAPSLQTVGSN